MTVSSRALLSPLDQLMPRTYTRVLLTFPASSLSFLAPLRLGLERTCKQLPYIRGKVFQSEEDGRLDITWSPDDPVVLRQMIAKPGPESLSSYEYSELKAKGMPLHFFTPDVCPVALRADHSKPGTGADAIVVSWTPLRGGMMLAVCVHHHVMDGIGVGELIQLLARNVREASNGKLTSSVTPDPLEPLKRIERLKNALANRMPQPRDTRSENPGSARPIGGSQLAGPVKSPLERDLRSLFKAHPEYTIRPVLYPSSIPPCTAKIFTLPVNKLRAVSTRIAPSMAFKPTVNTLIFALVWSRISSVRQTRMSSHTTEDPPRTSRLGFAVNGRRHLGADFEEQPYMGNVIMYGLAQLNFDKLVAADELHLGRVVDEISAAILKITAEHIDEVVSIVDQIPDVRAMQVNVKFFDGPDLTLTSWTGQDMYDADFGGELGKPDFVRVPHAAYDGVITLLPRKGRGTEGEVVEVAVVLRRDDMEALEKDDVWQRFTD